LESAVTAITGRVKDICGERNLEFEITQLGSSISPVLLSGEIVDLIGEKAREKNIEPLRMVSGAGHDTALLADLTEAGMIFVPSQKGRSHCPQEFTRLEDICLGCEVLLETALALAAS
jgi:acetylornithine deacetylase/succinyl-diaminopimelate desuccinylase-like protein